MIRSWDEKKLDEFKQRPELIRKGVTSHFQGRALQREGISLKWGQAWGVQWAYSDITRAKLVRGKENDGEKSEWSVETTHERFFKHGLKLWIISKGNGK